VSAPNVDSAKSRLETAMALARILERVEHSAAPVNADQYQVIVARLKSALSEDLPEDALRAVLGAHSSAAELYENMHYVHSGLSRASLERSVASEMLATQVLARVARDSRARNGSAN
jgi:hemoglobin-like flavoprotein